MSAELHPSLAYHLVNSLGWPALRPLQVDALAGLATGDNALILAPTAGGKTEAAIFPLLSRALEEGWQGLSILYVCPLRALLNNLEPRLSRYFELVGRRIGLWHGDVAPSRKAALRSSPPDLLLTTPESIEGMLLSRRGDARHLFGDLRAVVVDELHAFAGDDRGWHLMALLERLGRLAGGDPQRVGLSATVGRPQELLDFFAGSSRRPRRLLRAPPAAAGGSANPPEVQLDWVGSLVNAAKVIAGLHVGEKRLVFCDSRSRTEELARHLLDLGLTTYVSHSSLARDVRVISERAFSESPACVIVATSTLELGIDIGDLDRVIQIDAPGRVSSFLQRMGRTGRRGGARSNCLFLATHEQGFLRAAAILRLWERGYVEPAMPPPAPFHVMAQQLMALCLESTGPEGPGLPKDRWREKLLALPGFAAEGPEAADALHQFLLEKDLLVELDAHLQFGAESERRWQNKHFLELMSMITESPLFTVYYGRRELGEVDRASFDLAREAAPVLLLGGQAWQVGKIDWRKKRCWVTPVELSGRSRWLGEGQPLSFELCQAIREILAGTDLPDWLSRRGRDQLESVRLTRAALAAAAKGKTVLFDSGGPTVHWFTFGGLIVNATLAAGIGALAGPSAAVAFDNLAIQLPRKTADLVANKIQAKEPILQHDAPSTPKIEARALAALKFSDCLPPDLVQKVVRARWSDPKAAAELLAETPVRLAVAEATYRP